MLLIEQPRACTNLLRPLPRKALLWIRRHNVGMPDIGPSALMHATHWRHPFTAEGWVFENKFDGFRALVCKTGRTVELLSRSGRSMADQFPDIIRAVQAIPGSAILDAELVVLDDRGHAMFERIRRRAVMRLDVATQ